MKEKAIEQHLALNTVQFTFNTLYTMTFIKFVMLNRYGRFNTVIKGTIALSMYTIIEPANFLLC